MKGKSLRRGPCCGIFPPTSSSHSRRHGYHRLLPCGPARATGADRFACQEPLSNDSGRDGQFQRAASCQLLHPANFRTRPLCERNQQGYRCSFRGPDSCCIAFYVARPCLPGCQLPLPANSAFHPSNSQGFSSFKPKNKSSWRPNKPTPNSPFTPVWHCGETRLGNSVLELLTFFKMRYTAVEFASAMSIAIGAMVGRNCLENTLDVRRNRLRLAVLSRHCFLTRSSGAAHGASSGGFRPSPSGCGSSWLGQPE